MVRKKQRQLGLNNDIGQSIVRRLFVHEESIFTLEQRISIILKKKHGTWLGEFLRALCSGDKADSTFKPSFGSMLGKTSKMTYHHHGLLISPIRAGYAVR